MHCTDIGAESERWIFGYWSYLIARAWEGSLAIMSHYFTQIENLYAHFRAILDASQMHIEQIVKGFRDAPPLIKVRGFHEVSMKFS